MREITAHDYLNQAKALEHSIKSKLKEIRHLEEMAGSISSPPLDSSVQNGNKGSAPGFVLKLEAVIELKEEVRTQAETLIKLRRQILDVIKAVESQKDRAVLEAYFLDYKPLSTIADETGTTVRTIYRRYAEGLKSVKVPPDAIFI